MAPRLAAARRDAAARLPEAPGTAAFKAARWILPSFFAALKNRVEKLRAIVRPRPVEPCLPQDDVPIPPGRSCTARRLPHPPGDGCRICCVCSVTARPGRHRGAAGEQLQTGQQGDRDGDDGERLDDLVGVLLVSIAVMRVTM
ncbi:hypothetical protein WJ968_00635 [Achromobacter xylosoxidans]